MRLTLGEIIMSAKTWTLFDQDSNSFCGDGFRITPSDAGGSQQGYEISVAVGKAGLSEGVQVVTVNNGRLRFDILPTRGMSLWKAWYQGGDGEDPVGWKSPVRGPVHPKFVPLSEPSGLGWLDGFDELLVRCGLESNGAPQFDEKGQLVYPLHGRIGNKPAHRVELSVDGDTGEIAVTGLVDEVRFHFLKVRMESRIRTRVGSTIIEIHDTVTNLSASPAEIQLLYHVNFGQPLLDPGSRVIAPKAVAPRNARAAEGIGTWDSYAAEQIGYEEQVYFLDLLADADGSTQALLKNAHGTRGVCLKFNQRQLPCFTLWKNTTAAEDGYVTGLEPGTNFSESAKFRR